MDIAVALLIIAILFVVLCIFCAIYSATHSTPYSYGNNLYSEIDNALDEYALNAECAETVGVAQKNLEKIQDILYDAESYNLSENAMNQIRRYESVAKEAYDDLVFEKWEEKAVPVLDKFVDAFYEVINAEPDMFSFDYLTEQKRKCLKAYDRFREIKNTDVELKISPWDFMVQHLGSSFDQCMYSRWQIENKLNAAIEAAKPEKKRGDKLKSEMIKYVRSNTSIKRSVLKKHVFDGFSQQETGITYRLLIEENKLAEYKVGNRYFVCVVEKAKKPAKKTSAGLVEDSPVNSDRLDSDNVQAENADM